MPHLRNRKEQDEIIIKEEVYRKYAERIQTSYTQAVRQLENFWSLSADEISENQVREYFLY